MDLQLPSFAGDTAPIMISVKQILTHVQEKFKPLTITGETPAE
jgi:hypothetical protein